MRSFLKHLIGFQIFVGIILSLSSLGVAKQQEAVESKGLAVLGVTKAADGVLLAMDGGVMRLEVYSPSVIRVSWAKGESVGSGDKMVVIAEPKKKGWKLSETPTEVRVNAGRLEAVVDRVSGAVRFVDEQGQVVLAEEPGGREMTAINVDGLATDRSSLKFALSRDEGLYGLGQHPNGHLNCRGLNIHLEQKNMDVAVPVLVSSRGYGVLWDNPSITDVNSVDQKTVTWSSAVADSIDYYVMYGPKLDDVVKEYRGLSGQVPMFGRWVWGYWQSKEHYKTQQEVLDVVAKYRQLQIPLDVIVQDWRYWAPAPWGSHKFDPERYPDPAGMVAKVHEMNAHIMLSVWAKFAEGSENYQQLESAGLLYPMRGGMSYYDAFNPKGRDMYWQQIKDQLVPRGFDAWWLDATEPELNHKSKEEHKFWSIPTAMGPGAKVYNVYPLMTTTTVYDGLRKEQPDKRPFILTRSAFAGQQRNGAVTWSGDIRGTWEVLGQQIPAGLNFCITGIPYWNTDIGGFFVKKNSNSDPDYRELYARWFQFGAFCPMFRSHGTVSAREMWRFGDKVKAILLKYDQLRYRLLPYIYSTAWQVTSEGDTMMRPLVMDFTDDVAARDITDQYMFGRAMMVCPVTKAKAVSRKVYLPKDCC